MSEPWSLGEVHVPLDLRRSKLTPLLSGPISKLHPCYIRLHRLFGGGGDWCWSYDRSKRLCSLMALIAVSWGVRAFCSKMRRFLEVQIIQLNHAKALPITPQGGRFFQLTAAWSIERKVVSSVGRIVSFQGPRVQTSFAYLQWMRM